MFLFLKFYKIKSYIQWPNRWNWGKYPIIMRFGFLKSEILLAKVRKVDMYQIWIRERSDNFLDSVHFYKSQLSLIWEMLLINYAERKTPDVTVFQFSSPLVRSQPPVELRLPVSGIIGREKNTDSQRNN